MSADRPAPLSTHPEPGPRTALHFVTIAEIVADAKAIMREHPWSKGRSTGLRQSNLEGLAWRHGITIRTIYRYLHYREPVCLRVGPWSAWFAVKQEGAGTPVQLTAWALDDEAES